MQIYHHFIISTAYIASSCWNDCDIFSNQARVYNSHSYMLAKQQHPHQLVISYLGIFTPMRIVSVHLQVLYVRIIGHRQQGS